MQGIHAWALQLTENFTSIDCSFIIFTDSMFQRSAFYLLYIQCMFVDVWRCQARVYLYCFNQTYQVFLHLRINFAFIVKVRSTVC